MAGTLKEVQDRLASDKSVDQRDAVQQLAQTLLAEHAERKVASSGQCVRANFPFCVLFLCSVTCGELLLASDSCGSER